MLLEKTMLLECFIKSENWLKISGTEPGKDKPQSVGSRTLFYPISIMPPILIEDSGNLKHPKNVKSISNTTVYHLVSCRVIPWPTIMKRWEKEVLWKMHALGNLKCNKKIKSLKKYVKSNCIKSEVVQKHFSSIFLKLQVTSLDWQEIVRTTVS